ncbi:MAG: hypothetical protein MJ113_00170 [Lachnospiraceae bacterium]|nr:hypothetical protein [Lachnospiraceae bacterium]
MFIDDDEWFESTDEIINFFKSGEYKNYITANYYIRNYRDYEGHYSKTQIGRLFKMEEGVRFHGAIHEKLNLSFKNSKCLKDYVHHYGYVYKNADEYAAKVLRNRPILEEMLKNDPDNIDNAAQYLIELGASSALIENYNVSKKYAEQFFGRTDNPAYTLILTYYFSYMMDWVNSIEEIEAEYKKYYLIGKLSPVAPPIIDFMMGKMYMKHMKYRKAIHQFERYRAGVTLVRERVYNYEALLSGFSMSFYEQDVLNESLYLQATCFLVLCPLEGLNIQGFDLDEEGIKLKNSISDKDKLVNQEKAILLFKSIKWDDDMDDLFSQMFVFLYACKLRKRMFDFEESIKPCINSNTALFTAWRAFFEAKMPLPEYLVLVDVERIKKFVEKYPQYVENAKQLIVERKRVIEFNALKEQLIKEIESLQNEGKYDEARQLIYEAKKLGVEIN